MLHSMAESRNLTQKQISMDLGIPASTIGGYFQGTSEPDLETVKQLAQYFNCSVDYMLGNKSPQARSLMEDTLIHIFRTMTDSQQKLYIALGQTISQFDDH